MTSRLPFAVIRGIQGPKGETGDTGPQGEQGIQGDRAESTAEAIAAAETATTKAGEAAASATSANTSAIAAAASATSADTSAIAAAASASLAQLWAIKTDGPVSGGEYSAKKHAADAAASAAAAAAWDPNDYYTKVAADARFVGLINTDANLHIISHASAATTVFGDQAIEVRPPATYAAGVAGVGFHRPGLTGATLGHSGDGLSMYDVGGVQRQAFSANGDIWTSSYGWLHDRFAAASDAGLKRDVLPVSAGDAMAVVRAMQAVLYDYDTAAPAAKALRLPDGRRSGFLAQDLREIAELPSIVEERPTKGDAGEGLGTHLRLAPDAAIQILALVVAALRDVDDRLAAVETANG